MIDPDLERRLADCSELMESWRRFLDLLQQALKPPHDSSPQSEQQFLNCKARIAMLHDAFMESLKHDKATGSNMLEIVNRCITLRLVQKLSEPEQKKMEIEWHEVFLLLNETVSGLNEEKERLAGINEFAFKAKKLQKLALVRSKALLGSIYLKIAIVAGAIAFMIWGVPAVGIYDWDDLRDIESLQTVIAGFNKFSRSQFNWERPFIDINRFMDALSDKVPGAGTVDDRTAKTSQEEAIAALIPAMKLSQLDPSQTTDILSKATGYRLRSYKRDGGEERAFVFIFWFRQTSDARAFMTTYEAEKPNIPESYSVFRKVNVILIMQAANVDVRDRVKNVAIDPLPPVR